jgi:hypothetical protein
MLFVDYIHYYNESILHNKFCGFYLLLLNNGMCYLRDIPNCHDPNLGLVTNARGMER